MVLDGGSGMHLSQDMRAAARRSFRRLFAWYAVVLSIFGVVWWLFSALPPEPQGEVASPLTGDGALLDPGEMLRRLNGAAVSWTAALLQMLAALLLVIPLAVVYVRTRTRNKYDHTLVQTVIVLPVAIAAVLMMVRHSLALAFGLAGVVGAVRFRSNLKESGDSVYVFAAVAIGFAAGIHSLGIAALLSLLFSAIELSMWYWRIADPSAQQLRRIGLGEHQEAPDAPPARPEAPGRNQTLHVGADDLESSETAIAAVLTHSAKRWQLLGRHVDISSGGSLEYAVRLRKDVDLPELTRRLQQEAGGSIHTLNWSAGGGDSDHWAREEPANGSKEKH
jgi:hypothetical protein